MNLVINGQARVFEETTLPLQQLLELLELSGKPVVIELDQEPVLPAAYGSTALKEGSRIEIVLISAGG
jgi:sulfur carrier protein